MVCDREPSIRIIMLIMVTRSLAIVRMVGPPSCVSLGGATGTAARPMCWAPILRTRPGGVNSG